MLNIFIISFLEQLKIRLVIHIFMWIRWLSIERELPKSAFCMWMCKDTTFEELAITVSLWFLVHCTTSIFRSIKI